MNSGKVKGSQRPEQVRYITKSHGRRLRHGPRQLPLFNHLHGLNSNLLVWQVCVEPRPVGANRAVPDTRSRLLTGKLHQFTRSETTRNTK